MALKECLECEREISTEAKTCPHCGKGNPTRDSNRPRPLAIVLLILAALYALGSLTLLTAKRSSPSGSTTSPNAAIGSPSAAASSPASGRDGSELFAIDQMKLTFSWHKGGFETAMIVDFVITNGGSLPVKDLVVTCEHFGPSGTKIDQNVRTIYQSIPARSTRHVNAFNMGLIHSQATSSSCRVTDLRLDD